MRGLQKFKKDLFNIAKWNFLANDARLIYEKKLNKNFIKTLRIDLTNKCNFNCYYCLYKSNLSPVCSNPLYRIKKQDQEIDYYKLVNLIKKLKKLGFQSIILTGGGEPFLFSNFEKVIKFLIKNKIDFGIMTNGSKINERFITIVKNSTNFKWIRISVDASSEKTWKKMHSPKDASNLNKIRKNILKLVNIPNRKFIVGLNFLVTPINYKEILPFFFFARKLKVDNIRYTPVYTNLRKRVYKGYLNKILKQFKRLKNISKKYKDPIIKINESRFKNLNESNKTEICYFSFFSINLTTDFKVYPCCIKKGIISEKKEIKTKDIKNLYLWLKKYFKSRRKFNALSCKCCMYHEFNDYLDKIKNVDQFENFIP